MCLNGVVILWFTCLCFVPLLIVLSNLGTYACLDMSIWDESVHYARTHARTQFPCCAKRREEREGYIDGHTRRNVTLCSVLNAHTYVRLRKCSGRISKNTNETRLHPESHISVYRSLRSRPLSLQASFAP